MEGVHRSKSEREERERLERIEREMIEASIRAKAFAEESLKRLIHLTLSGETLKKYDRVLMDFAGENQNLKEWKVFTECREVPEISSLNQVNSFLAGWIHDLQMDARLEIVFKLSPNILKLINEMAEFLELPPENFSTEMVKSMGKIYHDIRRRQQEFIDQSTYNVMIDLRKLLDPELGVFESTLKTNQIVHSLWGNLYSCPELRGHYYEELNLRFRIPDSLVMVRGIYRILKTDYDHLSDTSNSFYQPGVPSFLREGIDTDIEKSFRGAGIERQESLPRLEELSTNIEQVTKKEDWGLVTSQVEGDEKKRSGTTTKRMTETLDKILPDFGTNGNITEKVNAIASGANAESLKTEESQLQHQSSSISTTTATKTATTTSASTLTTSGVEGRRKIAKSEDVNVDLSGEEERTTESEMVHDVSGRQAEVGGETNEDIEEKEEEQNTRSKSQSVSVSISKSKELSQSQSQTQRHGSSSAGGEREKEDEEAMPPPSEPEAKDAKDTGEQQEREQRSLQSQEKENRENMDVEMKKEAKNTSGDSSKKGGKKGKGKSATKDQERPKTEAELAKERERKEKAEFLPPQVHPNELNLRNYVIQAGVFNFKLLEIPSQPKEKGNWTLHLIEGERRLKEIPFVADYVPPALMDLHEVKKTPEEMEKEAKRQEEELQKLVQLEIKVPKTCAWFEPPTPVRWEPGLKVWSTDGFYDIRFNEDSLQLAFRTTKFGVLGLAHNRWSNLPYQSWELRPNGTNKATLSLMAAMAVVEFCIENDMICVRSLQNISNSDVIEGAIIGKFMKHRQLVKVLRDHGLDVFPELDSYAYVDGILVKHIPAEDHLYQCMAVGASAFNFHWSRWNLLAGREKMVYQLRERHGTATPGNYQMVLNTPRGASLINCTEVSPNYSEESLENSEYRADLIQLLENIYTPEAREKIELASGHFVETIRLLLTSVRPLTFS